MNSARVRAFAPGHITGFFQIFPNGSTGAGVNTALGVSTEVYFIDGEEDKVELNAKASKGSVSLSVLDAFSEFRTNEAIAISHTVDYPIGFGMGMSGAGAFSLSLALNELLNTKLSYQRCMEIAKECEIRCGTGLGDVVAQQFPGVMMGLPPYPSTEVKLIDGTEGYVACAFFEAISTGSIIRNPEWVEKINSVGAECMAQLDKNCSRQQFMELSRKFSLETELPSEEVLEVLSSVPGSSMAMLGQTVFLLCNSVEEGIKTFEPYAEHILVSEIARTGALVRQQVN